MINYKHGIGIKEVATRLPLPIDNLGGVAVAFGTAPINMAKEPKEAVNKLFLCRNFDEARETLGYLDDYENYSLCQVMDAFFKVAKTSPVILCNVLDPNIHNAAYSETLTIINKQAVSTKKGILLEGLKVGNLTNDKYILSFNEEGYLVVTIVGDVSEQTITMEGKRIDSSKVKASDIIGNHNTETGKDTGLELVKEVFTRFGVIPGLLLAPGFSQIPEVGVMLNEKCKNISGLFSCECVVDIDTKKAAKLKDVKKVKSDSGFDGNRTICLYPMLKVKGKKMYASAYYAAMACKIDSENEFIPNISPSNKKANIEGLILDDGTEIYFDMEAANSLNSIGIVTAINFKGFRFWGNNTAAYPDTKDPKDRWIGVRRFFSWWGNNFVVDYFDKVDNLMNKRLIEYIVDAANVKGNALAAQEKCAGINVVFRKEDNPDSKLLDGKITFRHYLAPYTPAEYIEGVLEYDVDMLMAAIGGK